jgi:phosphoribosylamine---glycine ligase
MKILVIGSGGREHALTWKLKQSPKTTEIFVAPGNAGTAQIARNVPIAAEDIDSLVIYAKDNKIDLVVVGPEGPLAQGAADRLSGAGIPVFGPSQAAAEIESSKVFAKSLMAKYGIPCAKSVTFESYNKAEAYIHAQNAPIVVKADGLAAGKGVTVAATIKEADAALYEIMVKKIFGVSGNRVIVEEFLTGREVSALAFTDGKTIIPMVPACDYKPVYDGNKGPNTGGMGGFSPPSFYTTELAEKVRTTIMEPTVRAMAAEGRQYQGVLYCGLMLTESGPKVLEYNCRFGDPETQVILPRLKSELVDIMLAVINGTLDKVPVEWYPNPCVGVVMSSPGYPGKYETGLPITGLNAVDKDILIFHAGTKTGQKPGEVVTSGGRVLVVAATGTNIDGARQKVYDNLPKVHFAGAHYRKDIALR